MPKTTALVTVIAAALVALPPLPPSLASLRPHPRLLVPDSEMTAIWDAIKASASLRRWRAEVRARGERMLTAPLVTRGDGAFLDPSREAAERIVTLAGLFRVDGDRRWLERALLEMRAAAALADWNPAHFLDAAEMTAGMAIGYDWLYADLSADDRARFRDALLDKGVRPGLDLIARGALWVNEPLPLWTEGSLAGLVLGALAVADEAPAEAARVLEAAARPGLRQRLAMYAPDGGDRQGLGYWEHTTRYLVWLLAGLDTALGSDLGLAGEGLADIGRFRMYAIGTSEGIFNYGDAREQAANAPQMLWLAGRFDHPEYASHERARLRGRSAGPPGIFHLMWSARVPDREATAPPTAARFRGVEVAFLRGDWRDPRASWVGFKGGSNQVPQAHLDLGSFVFDALGERWALDPGAGDFALPGYLGAERWTYMRTGTAGHNTLLVNGGNQQTGAAAPLIGFSDDSYRPFAVADLTAAYAPVLDRAARGVALVDGRDLLVHDELEGAGGADVVWQMLTRAAVSAGRGSALLLQNGRTLTMRVLEPQGATIELSQPVVAAGEAPRPDVTVIQVRPPAKAETLRFVVWLSTGDRPPPEVSALSEWKGESPD